MYRFDEKKPEKSGKYRVQFVSLPGLSHHPVKEEQLRDECVEQEYYYENTGVYDKDNDEWTVFHEEIEQLLSFYGAYCTLYENMIGENFKILCWTELDNTEEFPKDLEKPFLAEDGQAFPEQQLVEFYNEFINLFHTLSHLYNKVELGFWIEDEETFKKFIRWYNLYLPFYNPETHKYEYREFARSEYKGEGYYRVLDGWPDNEVGFAKVDEEYKKKHNKMRNRWDFESQFLSLNSNILSNMADSIANGYEEEVEGSENKDEIRDKWDKIAKTFVDIEKNSLESFKKQLEQDNISEETIKKLFLEG